MIIKKTQKKIRKKHTLASTGLELNLQLGGARGILKCSSRLRNTSTCQQREKKYKVYSAHALYVNRLTQTHHMKRASECSLLAYAIHQMSI